VVTPPCTWVTVPANKQYQRHNTKMAEFKIVVLGDGGVGKSALVIQFVQHSFVKEYDPTIENHYSKTVTLDDAVMVLDILDTAGQEEYCAMRNHYIRTGGGFILVYSIISRETFVHLMRYRDLVLRVKESDEYPLVICGNKMDMEEQRAVSKEEGEVLGRNLACPQMETSAKTRTNVEEAFCTLLRAMRQKMDFLQKQEEEFNSLDSPRAGKKRILKNGGGLTKSKLLSKCVLS